MGLQLVLKDTTFQYLDSSVHLLGFFWLFLLFWFVYQLNLLGIALDIKQLTFCFGFFDNILCENCIFQREVNSQIGVIILMLTYSYIFANPSLPSYVTLDQLYQFNIN
eukprot:TRINITY_DN17366_c0_g1_i10.p4 TRINITY_DN17366_c0_g1~~TRINITY_DN17366_c0_g1_i10.p4  ORF type:complete len:108 (+),score=2.86 TRINITY_DN17366_c0_g1_i10:267-590(+)